MAQLVEIRRVEIGPENLTARVRLAQGCPLMTSEDLEGTARIYRLLPHIVEHACLGDAGETFRDAMGDTEVAHLLEHVTVELLAQTDLAGDMPAGRTWVDEVEERTYEIELACPDDVLVAAALSSGAWMLDWAFSGGGEPEPDVQAIVNGLVGLVESVEGEGEDLVVDYAQDFDAFEDEDEELPYEDDETEAEEETEAEDTVADEPAEPEASEPEPDAEPEPAPAVEQLWTPAPQVGTRAPRTRRAPAGTSEMEAEIDQIMATIEMEPLVIEEPAPASVSRTAGTPFDTSDLPDLTVPEPPVELGPEPAPEEEPVFEPQPDEGEDETGGEQIPAPHLVR